MHRCLLWVVFSVFLTALAPAVSFAVPPAASASCRISCRVAEIIEWAEEDFPDIDLGKLNARRKQAHGSSSLLLYTNGDVEINADNSETAQLANAYGAKLKTEYALGYDSAGADKTGANYAEWCAHESFLSSPSGIRHVAGDGSVEIKLMVRVSKKSIKATDAGQYTAVQTLTACWVP